MTGINPRNFKNDSRSLQDIASDILYLPLDKESHGATLPPTTFATCLSDSIDVSREDDSLTQISMYGMGNYVERAEALLKLVQEIAGGKANFLHEEMETLRDALTVVAGELKIRKTHYLEE